MINMASLDASDARDARRFGNKAANLAIAKQAGLAVPNGVGISYWGQPSLEEIRSELSALRRPLAVRSSSLAEDSEGSAFPGVFETVLGVRTEDEILDAIRHVRESAEGENLQAYLSGRQQSVQMAVLVQELIPAESGGVSFSRDPVTGARIVIIESGLGLGKSVVDGEITPDSYEFTHDNEMIQKTLGRKRIRFDYIDGLTRREVPAADSTRFALSDTQAMDVCLLTVAAEAILERPIDIEWAFDGEEKLWLLQARPITTLPKERLSE